MKYLTPLSAESAVEQAGMRTGRADTDVGIWASTVTASAAVRCVLAVCLSNHFPTDIPSRNRSQAADPSS